MKLYGKDYLVGSNINLTVRITIIHMVGCQNAQAGFIFMSDMVVGLKFFRPMNPFQTSPGH